MPSPHPLRLAPLALTLTCLAAAALAGRAAPGLTSGPGGQVESLEGTWGHYPPMEGSEAFFEAVLAGDIERVEAAIDERPELLGAGDAQGRSPFVVAILSGHRKLAKRLVARGYFLDAMDAALVGDFEYLEKVISGQTERLNEGHPIGGTILYGAALTGQSKLWQLLLLGADPNANPRGAGGVTAAFGTVECPDPTEAWIGAVTLFSSGGDVNAPQRGGWSVLHAAVARDHEPLVRFLLRKGARVDAADDQGRTPLDVARAEGLAGMVRLLENHGEIRRDEQTSRFACDRDGEPIEIPDLSKVPFKRRHAATRAAVRGELITTSQMLEGEPLLAFTRNGRDELAIEGAARSGRVDIIHELLDHGAPLSLPIAVAIGDLDRARAQLEEDPGRAHERASLDQPAMWYCAIGVGGVEAAKLLLEYGADVDQSSLGTTALHWAAREGDVALARFLLENGASLDAVSYSFSRNGRTPRQVAKSRRMGRVTQLFDEWASKKD